LLSNQLAAYFREASYNRFNITPATESHGTPNDGIVGWLTLNQNHPNTEGTTSTLNQQLAKNAIVAANPYVNFAAYDINSDGYLDSNELAVVVISAGYETSFGGTTCTPSPSVWGHQWSIDGQIVAPAVVDGKIVGDWHNNAGGYAQFGEIHGLTTAAGCNPANLVRYANHQATIGIMAHELGHLILRLPDLYDTTFASEGIGNFSLMAGGNWAFKTTDPYQGQSPVHPDAWCKLHSGWVDPVIDSIGPITLLAAGGSGVNATNAVYMQTTSDPNQYFLFENRGQYGYDAGLSGLTPGITGITGTPGGIAVWNVDETVRANASNPWAPNNTPDHKFIDLEEADNVSTMDTGTNRGESNDLYFAGNKSVFDNISSPNSRIYNGTSTGIALNSISTLAQNMTANFGSVLQAQTITFGTAPAVAVGVTGTLSATASSGLAVTLSSTTTATCTLSGSKVTGVAAGACVVAANQGGNATYAAAPQVTKTITIAVGGAGQTFTAPASITIRDNTTATLYQSVVNVNMSGTISKVVVALNGLTHTFPADLDILLVGPRGQKVMLMSDAGGGTNVSGTALTFDAAAAAMPQSTAITGTTYKPANYDTATDAFPAPAPAAPYSTDLAVFNGTLPNGTWSLFVRDDATGDVGQIANGFRLTISTGGAAPAPALLAAVTPASQAFGSVTTGTTSATQNITVTNSGSASLSVTGVALTGVDLSQFAVTNGCAAAVAPAGTCTIGVTFKPTTTGVKAAAVSITHNAAGSPNTVPVGGTGAAPGGVSVKQTVSNIAPITIRDNASASLYPAPVTISGMTGAITKVVVTVKGLTHAFTRDIDMLLVGPGGQKTILMSDTIGSRAISNLNMTFDAAAVNAVPADAVTGSGTYKPTDYLFGSSTDNFNITPPAGGTAGPAAPYTANFGVFTGLSGASLNGVWKLFVLDDGAADTGSISGGWTLAVTTQ
jgi:M6 family metalloprotease-like protein